jgi:mono/diheme cytochrome c family protein
MAMNTNRMLIVAVASLGAAGWGMAAHADAKAKFAADCAECHEAGDFEGEDAAALADTMKKMAAGQMKHKTAIKLSEAEITAIAAYMAKGGK